MEIQYSGYEFVRVNHNKNKTKWFVEKLYAFLWFKVWWRISVKFKDKGLADNFVKYKIIKSK